MGMDQYIFLEKEDKVSGKKSKTEICCWRRYYRLHNFIFEDLGGKILRDEMGLFDAELTVGQLETIRRFVLDPDEYAEKDDYGTDPYETADDEVMAELKKKWDAAITECLETVKKSNDNKDSPRLKIIYHAAW